MMKWDIRLKIGIVALLIGGILFCVPEGALPAEIDFFGKFCLRLGAFASFWGMFYMMRRAKYGR